MTHISLCLIPYLQGLPASGQFQLDVLLGQVAGVLLRLQPLLQSVLITAERQGDLREGSLGAETVSGRSFHPGFHCTHTLFYGFCTTLFNTIEFLIPVPEDKLYSFSCQFLMVEMTIKVNLTIF